MGCGVLGFVLFGVFLNSLFLLCNFFSLVCVKPGVLMASFVCPWIASLARG